MTVFLSSESPLVSREERESLNNHKGRVLWFTGLSGAGKSSLARNFDRALFERGIRSFILDGDNIRAGLNQGLGFSDEDRRENIRRVAEVAKLMVDAGLVVIVALISPKQEYRDQAKRIIGEKDFSEIFVDCDLKTCQDRDPKGFYKKAARDEIKNYTGLASEYESPLSPDLAINTSTTNEEDSLKMLLNFYIT